jgi:deoxyribonuclease V
MRIEKLHDWNVSIEQALEIQRNLAKNITQQNNISSPRLIAGLDVSVDKSGGATAVAVVLNYPELKLIETAKARGKVDFPYVPGLLSFREVPLTLKACEQLTSEPDLFMVDGQGIAHPRRIGLASHLGLFLNAPTIGCAKSHLCGKFEQPGIEFGSTSKIIGDEGETIGAVIRTKTGTKSLFVSVGHKIRLSSAVHWVLQCCKGYRLPEPTRLAHLASKENI